MYSITGTTIKLTRGDTLVVTLSLTRNGEEYTPEDGDSILFAVKTKLNPLKTAYIDASPIISKEIPTDTMTLTLNPSDTAGLAFGQYYYDIQVTFANGSVDTVINNARLEIIPEVA